MPSNFLFNMGSQVYPKYWLDTQKCSTCAESSKMAGTDRKTHRILQCRVRTGVDIDALIEKRDRSFIKRLKEEGDT